MVNKVFAPGTVIDSPWLNDVNTETYQALTPIGGTGDAITAIGPLSLSPTVAGVMVRFLPGSDNTGAATININGLGVKSITKFGATALVAGDLKAGVGALLYNDGTRWQLINPQTFNVSQLSGTLPIAKGGTGAITAAAARTALGSTATGDSLFTAATADAALTALGATAIGKALLAAATAAAGRTAIDAMQEGPAFSASRITTDQGISDATFTAIIFNSEDLDTEGCYDPSNGRFTPNVAGWYQINAYLGLETSSGTITNGQVVLYKNGATHKQLATDLAYPGLVLGRSGAALVQFNGTTDYLQVYAYIDGTAGTQRVNIGSSFSGFFVHA